MECYFSPVGLSKQTKAVACEKKLLQYDGIQYTAIICLKWWFMMDNGDMLFISDWSPHYRSVFISEWAALGCRTEWCSSLRLTEDAVLGECFQAPAAWFGASFLILMYVAVSTSGLLACLCLCLLQWFQGYSWLSDGKRQLDSQTGIQLEFLLRKRMGSVWFGLRLGVCSVMKHSNNTAKYSNNRKKKGNVKLS